MHDEIGATPPQKQSSSDWEFLRYRLDVVISGEKRTKEACECNDRENNGIEKGFGKET